MPREDEVTRRGQNAAKHWVLRLMLGRDLASSGVNRRHRARDLFVLAWPAAGEELAWLIRFARLHLLVLHRIAALDDWNVPELVARMVRGRRPVLATHITRAGDTGRAGAGRRRAGGVLLDFLLRVVLERLAGLGLKTLAPGQPLYQGHPPDEVACLAV